MRSSREEKSRLLPRVHPLAIVSEERQTFSTLQRLTTTLLSVSAGIGGFLFGYDTGVVSGALPFMRDDLLRHFKSNRHVLNLLEEVIVSSAILAAACGSAMGGWLSDKIGRKTALICGDVLFGFGALMMAASMNVTTLITGRVIVGLGVGLASVTVPVYIAECSPVTLRASLVTVNTLMITTGQLVSFIVNYGFTYVPGTWRWMLGVAAVPAMLQFFALCLLPESPRWLFITGSKKRAQKVLRQLMPPEEVTDAENEMNERLNNPFPERNLLKVAYAYPAIRYELLTGTGLQILQQLCGINTVMYYTPTILEMAGFVNKRQALFFSILPAFINSLGTVIGMWCIDRYGRRKLLLWSLSAVICSLFMAAMVFYLDESSSGKVIQSHTGIDVHSFCPAANCHDCLNSGITESSCSFCTTREAGHMLEGVCVHARDVDVRCPEEDFIVYESGCPSPYQMWTVTLLMLYLLSFAPGLGPVPWAINAEIYPEEIRGLAGGAAATSNWITNFVVSQFFLTIAEAVGISGVFLIYAGIACIGAGLVWRFLPETKGLTFEEIQRMFISKVIPLQPK